MAYHFTVNEIAEYHAIFHSFPVDDQDRIRTRHLVVLLAAVGRHPDDEEIQEIIIRLKDPRYIRFREFLEILAPVQPPEDEFINAFRILNITGNERVSAAFLRDEFQNNMTHGKIKACLAVVNFDEKDGEFD